MRLESGIFMVGLGLRGERLGRHNTMNAQPCVQSRMFVKLHILHPTIPSCAIDIKSIYIEINLLENRRCLSLDVFVSEKLLVNDYLPHHLPMHSWYPVPPAAGQYLEPRRSPF